jgi:hypothetical protein
LTEIDRYVEPESLAERANKLALIQGTVRHRIAERKLVFSAGIVCLAVTVSLLVMLVRPGVWRDHDIAVYNGWINSLPARLFDETQDHTLSTVDVEMLGHLAEERNVLQELTRIKLRSEYLYNFGTVVAKAYLAVLTAANQVEEEAEEMEAAEKPSFNFPVQLLSNSARFYPHDEDTRRNLELAIMFREKEENRGSEEVQGDIGPPTPGFSRDMKQMLF